MPQDKPRTLDDLHKCAGKLSLTAVLHLLNSYKATRITEVPETAYADFIDHCEIMVSTADMTLPTQLGAEPGSYCRLC